MAVPASARVGSTAKLAATVTWVVCAEECIAGDDDVPLADGRVGHIHIRGENVTVVSLTTVLVIVYILANLLVDLLYAALDPRIRYE